MMLKLGIRREDKNEWEKRTPLIPDHIKKLFVKHQIQTIIQPSLIRTFSDEEYVKNDAIISENLSECKAIFAVKEIPIDLFETDKIYVFFSHTIKGQDYNMPMLKKMMEKKCTLIDYERIVNEKNIRLIFFGKYAGIAGMIDTLWSFGQRLQSYHKISTPYSKIKKTYQYENLESIKKNISEIGSEIEQKGLPNKIPPIIVGFTGYGNVSKGAQEILDLLPCITIKPDEIASIIQNPSSNHIYKVVFKEEHIVQPIDPAKEFNLQEYYQEPEKYQSIFDRYIPNLTILMNCIYWDERYPRLITKKYLSEHFQDNQFLLQIVGDISVDINGAIEATGKVTTPENPSFTYQPTTDTIYDDFSKPGIVIMAVDNLPCELPKESSEAFSNALYPFIPDIINADYTKSFEDISLPNEIKNAVVLYKGELTPQYEYINKYL